MWVSHWLSFYAIALFLPGSYITTWEWQFSSISYGKKWGSLWRLLMKKLLVKISENLLPHFWHITVQRPHTWADTLLRFGLWKYYIWAVTVSNFSPLNEFLLSILIIFPVRLIMGGVLWSPSSPSKERQKETIQQNMRITNEVF